MLTKFHKRVKIFLLPCVFWLVVIVKDCILVVVKEMALSHALFTYEPFLVKELLKIVKEMVRTLPTPHVRYSISKC